MKPWVKYLSVYLFGGLSSVVVVVGVIYLVQKFPHGDGPSTIQVNELDVLVSKTNAEIDVFQDEGMRRLAKVIKGSIRDDDVVGIRTLSSRDTITAIGIPREREAIMEIIYRNKKSQTERRAYVICKWSRLLLSDGVGLSYYCLYGNDGPINTLSLQ